MLPHSVGGSSGQSRSVMTCVTESGEATFHGEALPTTENAAFKLFKFGLQGIIS